VPLSGRRNEVPQEDVNLQFKVKAQGSRFKVQGSRFKVQGSRFKVQGSNATATLDVIRVHGRSTISRGKGRQAQAHIFTASNANNGRAI
jgi:RNase P/RNase MRP subunit p29